MTAHTTPERRPRVHEESVDTATAHRVVVVHRIGAFAVAAVLAVFGVLGFVGGLDFFSTDGGTVAGLSSNGLLSTISLVTAAVLVAAAVKGGRVAGIVMTGVGVAFLLSAFWHLFVLNTSLNVLAFAMSNVIFSIVVGLLLLTLGLYGRVSGNLPEDNPYRANLASGSTGDDEEPELPPATAAERRAERAMREAEVAVTEHRATAQQRAMVEAMAHERTKAGRRRVWMQHS
ncbi:protein of unknown function [Klenkia soli]|uniref:DUF4383 domain-containing protein n=1 Tax=Klenkia soli TaxID=1052260 RepID=A0A1H0PCV1_9ACTN|nr:DUF4383 domain-containing protein [Klenkia soli]SDP02525.1 protein of unknown function [Klenkia soli]